jgi:hypothetical protein
MWALVEPIPGREFWVMSILTESVKKFSASGRSGSSVPSGADKFTLKSVSPSSILIREKE